MRFRRGRAWNNVATVGYPLSIRETLIQEALPRQDTGCAIQPFIRAQHCSPKLDYRRARISRAVADDPALCAMFARALASDMPAAEVEEALFGLSGARGKTWGDPTAMSPGARSRRLRDRLHGVRSRYPAASRRDRRFCQGELAPSHSLFSPCPWPDPQQYVRQARCARCPGNYVKAKVRGGVAGCRVCR